MEAYCPDATLVKSEAVKVNGTEEREERCGFELFLVLVAPSLFHVVPVPSAVGVVILTAVLFLHVLLSL